MQFRFFLLFLLATLSSAHAQTYLMSATTVSTCSGNFYDTGGSSSNYSDNENTTMTFNSSSGNRLQFSFTTLATSSASDVFYIYDGTSVNAPLIGSYSGVQSPFTVQSTGASLTFRFVSNSSGNNLGWAASISCTTPVLTVYPMSNGQTVTTCDAVFCDDAGTEASYSHNQNSVMTFCPLSSSDYLVVSFPYQLKFTAGDSLYVYSGTTTSSAPLAVFSQVVSPSTHVGSVICSPVAGGCLTFRFVSDGSGNDAGWQGIISCSSSMVPILMTMHYGTIPVCSATFYDSGGSADNYDDNETRQLTLTSANGNCLQASFSTLATSSASDVFYIYDGTSVNAPLIGSYSGVQSAFSVQSTGTSLTFRFVSNSSGNNLGWAATISCITPVLPVYPMSNGQTVTTCNAVFCDDGGTEAAYSHNQNSVMTFCPLTSTDFLTVTFPYQFKFTAGDTLYVYSGTTTSGAPLAVYSQVTAPSTLYGSIIGSPVAGGCLTFRFVSDASGNDDGWQGIVSCSSSMAPILMTMHYGTIPVCSASFYDSGGSSDNYDDNEIRQVTLTSANGNRLQASFTTLATSSASDVFYIYDGNSVNAPLIGSYSGVQSAFSVQSTGTSLTFRFVSNSSGNNLGWAATISCTTPVLPVYPMSNGQTVTTCDAVFCDDGGTEANYSHNQNSVMTFCPLTSTDFLTVTFPYQFKFTAGDTLYVYSGTTTSGAPLAVYSQVTAPSTLYGSIIGSPVAGGCLTFRFVSDASGNDDGWQGIISCSSTMAPIIMSMHYGTIPVCGGSFYDTGGSSKNYDDNEVKQVTLTSSSGCSIQASFSTFATSSVSDHLDIYDGSSTAAPLIGSYAGVQSAFAVQSTGTALTFRFVSNSSGNNLGWAATLSCPTTTLATVTPPGPVSICTGDSLTLTANSATSYLWSTGDTTSSITVNAAGNYSVTITNNIGCTATSGPVVVTVNAPPAVPTVTQNGAILSSTAASSYQWYLNNVLIPGATSQNYTAVQNGMYTVVITDANGCTATSAPYNFNSVGLADAAADPGTILLIPNPCNGKFRVQANGLQQGRVVVYNVIGERVYESALLQPEINLGHAPKGVYFVEVRLQAQTFVKKLVIE